MWNAGLTESQSAPLGDRTARGSYVFMGVYGDIVINGHIVGRTPMTSPGDSPTAAAMPDLASQPVYNVQIQDDAPGGIHADWSGAHAAATYQALRSVHLQMRLSDPSHEPILQIDWGAYECTLRVSQVRTVIERALNPPWDWRAEPLETLAVGNTHLVGTAGTEPPGSRTLGWLYDHLAEGHLYRLTAEIFE